jgi:kumamolisin
MQMQKRNCGFPARLSAAMAAAVILIISTYASAQYQASGPKSGTQPQASPRTPQAGYVYTPASDMSLATNDVGLRAHTTYLVRSADGSKPKGLAAPQSMRTNSTLSTDTIEEAETPASMGCLYVQSPTKRSTGCIPNSASGTKGPTATGWGAIAIVDAYDNPYALNDFKAFVKYWGLSPSTFIKMYANGNGSCSTPPPNSDWAVEESLDIEWAHVFAPKAAIILVEACSNSFTDLAYAEGVAFNYIQQNFGGGQVTNSWTIGEFSGETSYDPVFAGWHYNYQVPTIAFASAGDAGCGGLYPSSSPWVISAGGTSVLRNSDGTFNSESCWGGSGGGFSGIETYTTSFSGSNMGPWADFQYPIFGQASRQTPDISFNADPASGVWIYNQYTYGGWGVVGGTSVSSPSLASIVNRANNRLSTWYGYDVVDNGWFTNEEATLLYSQLPSATNYYTNFYDVTAGSNGCTVSPSWDYCTGVGSPRDLLGK